MNKYSMTYNIRWSDLDANGHVNYSAYVDATEELLYRFFSEQGFPPDVFLKLGIGAVYSSITANFFREVRVGESISITYTLTGLSPKGVRWKVHHDILKSNGKKAVVIDMEGIFLDLNSRRPTLPTPEILAILQQVPHSQTFEELSEARFIR